mgnify:CR=1 FL=1
MKKRITISVLDAMKASREKFVMITAYDATFARLASEVGAEAILVGDSLGMVLQGHETTIPVSLDAMVYHTECVARARPSSLVVADLPFMSFSNSNDTLHASTRLMQAGAQMVKLEGGTWLSESIHQLVERGVPVCAHLGLTPQSVNVFGGYRVQGRTPKEAKSILADAVEIQDAGASLLVLECVPANLAADISSKLDIPVIGIGAGADTDGQVLVLHDMLGIIEDAPKYVQNFMDGATSIKAALQAFVEAVKSGTYPKEEHTYK